MKPARRSAQTCAIGVMSASSRLGAIASIRLRPRSSIVTAGDCPRPTHCPTGAELVSAYLEPLAATPELAAVIETNARVTAISRQGVDKVVSRGRETRPFVLAVTSGKAFAVIWRARLSTPRAHGRRQIRSGRAACRPWAKPSSPIGSPMAFRISSAAIVISTRVERRSS